MLYFHMITLEEYLHNNARHGKASYWGRGRHGVVAHTVGEGGRGCYSAVRSASGSLCTLQPSFPSKLLKSASLFIIVIIISVFIHRELTRCMNTMANASVCLNARSLITQFKC